MSVAKIVELSVQSQEGFDQAIRAGVEKASKTIQDIQSAWVEDQEVLVENGKVAGYKVHLKITFLVRD